MIKPKIMNFTSLISNFYIFSGYFFFLTDVAYRKENSFMFKKHSDTKNLHEKCSTYYNGQQLFCSALHKVREIRVERAKTKRNRRITKKEGRGTSLEPLEFMKLQFQPRVSSHPEQFIS